MGRMIFSLSLFFYCERKMHTAAMLTVSVVNTCAAWFDVATKEVLKCACHEELGLNCPHLIHF